MAGKPRNKVGRKFGMLTVIRDSGSRDENGGHVLWECLCECGNIAKVNGSRLEKGRTQSCGCLVSKDLSGEKFGLLTVKEDTGKKNKIGNKIWLCVCECGGSHEVATGHLQRGRVQSCGCLHGRTSGGDALREWREGVLSKLGNHCNICGISGEDTILHVHHLNDWSNHVSERYDLENGAPLCGSCHKDFHKEYGIKINTKEQYREFFKKHCNVMHEFGQNKRV